MATSEGSISRVEGQSKLHDAAAKTRRGRPGEPRLNYVPHTHPDEGVADKFKIVELRVAGKSNPEIGKELHRSPPTITWALGKMGFPRSAGAAPFYSFGEIFDREALRVLYELSGLSVSELARHSRIPEVTLWVQLRAKRSTRLHFNTARKAAEWRRELFRYLMCESGRGKTFGQGHVIQTFFPNLKERYSFLLQALQSLREALRAHPNWSGKELQNHLCAQAMLETAADAQGGLFVRFLPWAPELMPELTSRLECIRGIYHKKVALEILAGTLRTTAPLLRNLINPFYARRIKRIPRNEMAWLIRNYAISTAGSKVQKAGTERRQRGRKGEIQTTTQARITLAACLRMQGLQEFDIAAELYPIHGDKQAAWNAYKNSILKAHAKKISDEQQRLSNLPKGEVIAEIDRAKKAIPGHGS